MSGSDENEESAQCGRASQAAREVLLEECGPETFKVDIALRDEAKGETQKELGILEEDDDPPCAALIEEGFTAENCNEFPNVQQLVYCMVFNTPPREGFDQPLIDEFDGDRSRATKEAWRIFRRSCSGK